MKKENGLLERVGRHTQAAFGVWAGHIQVSSTNCSWISAAFQLTSLRFQLFFTEFGSVLATCSFDRTASVWEETIGEQASRTLTSGPVKKWTRRTNLVDSRTSVTDVKFGPKNLGLQLATCSADGIIRIYEAPDIMNISQWTLQHEIQCKLPLSCLAWNPSMFRLHAPMIAVKLSCFINIAEYLYFCSYLRLEVMSHSRMSPKYLYLSTAN